MVWGRHSCPPPLTLTLRLTLATRQPTAFNQVAIELLSQNQLRQRRAGVSARTLRRLRQVEQQYLGLARPLHYELLLFADRGAVALVKALAVQFDCSLCYLKPGVTALAQFVLRVLPGAEQGDI